MRTVRWKPLRYKRPFWAAVDIGSGLLVRASVSGTGASTVSAGFFTPSVRQGFQVTEQF
jgi:hypothetical protein